MEIAVRVLKRILNMDFGWTKLLFGMGFIDSYPSRHTPSVGFGGLVTF